MGIRALLVPEGNRKDLEEVPRDIQTKMRFVFVKSMDEVLEHALVDPAPARALAGGSPRRGGPKHAPSIARLGSRHDLLAFRKVRWIAFVRLPV
jgi:hypothetical protein